MQKKNNEKSSFPWPEDRLFKIIALHEETEHHWQELTGVIPQLTRGWYELARVSKENRIEFTKDYWLQKCARSFERQPQCEHKLVLFFEQLEDIGIYLTQYTKTSPFEVMMLYSGRSAKHHFVGQLPAQEDSLHHLEHQFSFFLFPESYFTFLKIHDGMCKFTDVGLLGTKEMSKKYQLLKPKLDNEDVIDPFGYPVASSSLIPFYEGVHLHQYQCFYNDWRPENEPGNVQFSEIEGKISNFLDNQEFFKTAFPSFFDWLFFYLIEE